MQLHVYNADDIAFIGKSPDLQCMLDTLHLWFVCLFVCLGLTVPLEIFSLVRRRHHYQGRAGNFDLCSAFMATEQWGLFSVPDLL